MAGMTETQRQRRTICNSLVCMDGFFSFVLEAIKNCSHRSDLTQAHILSRKRTQTDADFICDANSDDQTSLQMRAYVS